MMGAKNKYWMVTPEESRAFIKWLKSLFGMKADTKNSSKEKSSRINGKGQDSFCKRKNWFLSF